ncbi:MAG: putative deacylase [Oceanicoccus sp.]|jgi:predicted deacylase
MLKAHSLKVEFGNEKVDIPYFKIKGHKPGPSIFLSGGMHGDEINGMAVIEAFISLALDTKLADHLRGEITIIPLLNPSGFAHMQREVFEDGIDLNRSFGLEKVESLAHQMAADLTEKIFTHCEFGMDFHDAGKRSVLLPHSRIHKNEACGSTRKMGQILGTKIIVEREGHENMMAIYLNQKHQIPVLTVETGGAQILFPDFIETALQGIQNILISKDMMDGEIKLPKEQYFLHERYGVKIDTAAEIKFSTKLGDNVHAGEVIGKIYHPQSGRHESITSPMCGIIFSQWQRNQVPAEEIIYSILETEKCHVKRSTLDKFEKVEM